MKKYVHLVAGLALIAQVAAGALPVAPPSFTARVDDLRKQIRANFFVPDPLPALAAKTYRIFSPAPGVKAEAVTYATQLGLRVPAILYLPDPLPPGKIPGFVVVTGHGGDKYSWYSYYTGILFARGGAAVLTYDQVGEGERNVDRKSATRSHDSIKGGPVMARHLAGLMITDAMQAVSYLSQRPEVDASRIATGGYSLGSFVVALTGAVDPRIHACVLCSGGTLDGPGGFWDKSKPMCQALPYQSLDFLGDRPAVIYALHAARGATLIFNGLGDTAMAIASHDGKFFSDLQTRTTQLSGSPANVFTCDFAPPDCGHRPYWLTRPVVLWLDRQIHFPHWTEAMIRTMPETKISDWSQKYGVFLEKIYATPLREGGTPALGNDVPGYSRDQLNVFTPTEWEAQKTNYILDTWVIAAEKDSASAH